MKKLTLLLVATAFLLFSCKKENIQPVDPNQQHIQDSIAYVHHVQDSITNIEWCQSGIITRKYGTDIGYTVNFYFTVKNNCTGHTINAYRGSSQTNPPYSYDSKNVGDQVYLMVNW